MCVCVCVCVCVLKYISGLHYERVKVINVESEKWRS